MGDPSFSPLIDAIEIRLKKLNFTSEESNSKADIFQTIHELQ
jgi:hypothetical protein